jgi:hypothetical protein
MRRVAMVAGVVPALYGLWVVIALWGGHDARDFAIINRSMVERCHDSSVIQVDPTYHYQPPNVGYDGAFYYLIALDPLHAACYVDTPGYRYGRILYPLAARTLALGQPSWIPATLILVNLLALTAGTAILALWLSRKGLSPWLALIFGLYPGLFVSLWRDLTEPLSYALVALAVYLFDFGGRRRSLWAGVAFGLAALARETAVIFTFVYGLVLLYRRRWREGAELLALGILPLAAYTVFLRLEFGSNGTQQPASAPFSGLTSYWPWQGEQIDLVLAIVVPGLICAALACWSLARRRSAEAVSLLANVTILVIFLPAAAYVEYYAAGRASAGVILAALLCLPLFDQVLGRNRTWLWVVSVCWLLPWYALVPQAITWANASL